MITKLKKNLSNFFENVSKIIMRKSQYDNKLVISKECLLKFNYYNIDKLVKVQEKATKVVLD